MRKATKVMAGPEATIIRPSPAHPDGLRIVHATGFTRSLTKAEREKLATRDERVAKHLANREEA